MRNVEELGSWFEKFEFVILFDIGKRYQIGFQDPASKFMEGLIDLHNDLWFYLFGVLGFLFFSLFCIGFQNVCVFVMFISDKETFCNKVKIIAKPSEIQHNTLLETIWTCIPCFILVLAAAPSFSLLYEAEHIGSIVYSFKVIGSQWFWSFEVPYESKIGSQVFFESYGLDESDLRSGMPRLLAVDNRLNLPIRVQIRIMVSSTDVLHSFCVPSLGLKTDACPGRVNHIGLWISRVGVYYGQCSEICGIRHGFMPLVIAGVSDVDKAGKGSSEWVPPVSIEKTPHWCIGLFGPFIRWRMGN